MPRMWSCLDLTIARKRRILKMEPCSWRGIGQCLRKLLFGNKDTYPRMGLGLWRSLVKCGCSKKKKTFSQITLMTIKYVKCFYVVQPSAIVFRGYPILFVNRWQPSEKHVLFSKVADTLIENANGLRISSITLEQICQRVVNTLKAWATTLPEHCEKHLANLQDGCPH